MECVKCGSRWESSIKSNKCPFCGEIMPLGRDTRDTFNNIEEVLKYIVETFGICSYSKSSILISYISDLAPQFDDEKRLIKACAASGVVEKIAEFSCKSNEEKIIFISKYTSTLHKKYFLDEKAVATVLHWLTYGAGWKTLDSYTKAEPQNERKSAAFTKEKLDLIRDFEIVIQKIICDIYGKQEDKQKPEDTDRKQNEKNTFCGVSDSKGYSNIIIKSKEEIGGFSLGAYSASEYSELSKEQFFCEAISEYYKLNYIKAFDLFQKSSQNGNYFSLAYVGLMYYYGDGIEKDYYYAFDMFQKGAERGCPLSTGWLCECLRLGRGYSKEEKTGGDIFKKIESDLKNMATQGNVEALYFLGADYMYGLLANKNPICGLDFLKKACENGSKRAGRTLGRCYYFGTGVAENDDIAFEYLYNNKTDDNDSGNYLLGRCYYFGDGVDLNYNLAFRCFELAAKLGHGKSIYFLGRCYLDGQGIEKNMKKAIECFTDAVNNHKDESAALELAYIYSDGKYEDEKKYMFYLKKSAELGESNAQIHLANEYLRQENKKNAIYWAQKSAEQGNAEAQILVGSLMVADNEMRAFEWFLKAAKQGNSEAEYIVGGCYYNYIGVKEDKQLANDWYKRAARQGHTLACLELGKNYINGDGIDKNETHGIAWLKKAVNNECVEAILFLSKFYIIEKKCSLDEAFHLLKKINFNDMEQSEKGEAYYLLACCYDNGYGCAKDKKTAKKLYKKADENGYKNNKFRKFF